MPLLSEISKSDHLSGTPLSIHLQQYQGETRMTSNEARSTSNMTSMFEKADTSTHAGQRKVPPAADSQIAPRNVVSSQLPLPAEHNDVADFQIAPRKVISLQTPLPAEQDDVADSQIGPRYVASLQFRLPAEQDDLTDPQLTFNPVHDSIDRHEHILAPESENMQEQA